MISTIPFAGFYNTWHGAALDQALQQMFSDRETGCTVNDGLQYRASDSCQWGDVHRAYAKEYAEQFLAEHGIKGEFESMTSPREYNFTTDRIFVRMADGEAERLLATVDAARMDAVCAAMFTSRSGFISFYSPAWLEWGPVPEWDHNQLGALIVAHVPETDGYEELALMESAQCNGRFDQWITDSTPGIEGLFKVLDYLGTRAAREGTI